MLEVAAASSQRIAAANHLLEASSHLATAPPNITSLPELDMIQLMNPQHSVKSCIDTVATQLYHSLENPRQKPMRELRTCPVSCPVTCPGHPSGGYSQFTKSAMEANRPQGMVLLRQLQCEGRDQNSSEIQMETKIQVPMTHTLGPLCAVSVCICV